MVEPGGLKLELVHNVSQARSSCDLGKHHNNELAPAVQSPVLTLGTEAISLDFAKIMSVKKMKQLMKNCVRICHGLNLLSFKWVTRNRTISRKARSRPTLFC
jgi:hypothetical protein